MTRPATSSRSRARRRRTSRASSRPATSSTTRTARRSRRRAAAVWPRSTPSAGSRRAKAIRRPRWPRPARASTSRSAGYPRPMAEWIDLLDPDEKTLHDALPRQIHERALDLLLQSATHDDEPRPRLEGHDHYVFGVFLLPIAVREEDRIFYQEIDIVATRDRVLTVRKTPERGQACDLTPARLSVDRSDDDRAGMIVY